MQRNFAAMLLLVICANAVCVLAADGSSDFEVGLAYRMEGKNGAAVETFRKVPSTSPYYVQAMIHLGAALEDLGKKKEAVQAYESCLKQNPGNQIAIRNLTQLNSAMTCEKIIKLPSTTKDELIYNAFSAAKAKDAKRAADLCRLYIGLFSSDPRSLFTSAIVSERMGDFDQAIEIYEEAMELFPDFIPARVNHVLALVREGNREAALKVAQKALETRPENKQLRSLAELVKQLPKTDRNPAKDD
ncbi:tetratricopeptide repeat protein [Desulfomonile tiedjei]|uniref:Tetratricopeptide repeat protein n=1 Tax=Desulfomonile tiedjei (strain ATCC 49306 / DSM 6799 / DCB-1) TaxID=706587 RepID=I4C8A2_DESTA|nr:tetratricopeptide repeat protein [Desulfomonile tiedjei]AFM25793.1 tetratricopeptide repeat protein [Desulfomonile tiedjei DSM 6799]